MPAGRPSKYRPKFHCEDFITQSRQGKTLAQIAAGWDVDRQRLYDWAEKHKEFRGALKRGREIAEAWYMNILHAAVVGKLPKDVKFNLGAFVWATKNMFKWTDRVEQEIETRGETNVVYKVGWDDDTTAGSIASVSGTDAAPKKN